VAAMTKTPSLREWIGEDMGRDLLQWARLIPQHALFRDIAQANVFSA